MIQINLTEPNSQDWEAWKKKCATKTAEALAQFKAGHPPAISALYKAQKKVFSRLCYGKCAYCEKKIASSQHGDVDHYRPKSGVAEEDWTPVQLRRNGRTGLHPGYFWLAYTPGNLIFCCISCNQIGEGRRWGKGTRFPVGVFRAEEPGEEADEERKLLNPFLDNPEEHIKIDATGVYSPVNSSEMGQVSSDIRN